MWYNYKILIVVYFPLFTINYNKNSENRMWPDIVVTCSLMYTSDYSLAREKQHPVTNGSDEAPFYNLNLSSQIKKGINLKLIIITEHFGQKQCYKNGINYLH